VFFLSLADSLAMMAPCVLRIVVKMNSECV
jgi:hypothetical protein